MAIYYKCTNNGVVAVMTQRGYEKMQERRQLEEECVQKSLPRPQLPPVLPIFTFSTPDHHSFLFMTGSLKLLEGLLDGQTVHHGGIWVPFSNGIELSPNNEEARWEQQFRTNLDQAIEAFGLTVPSVNL